MASHSKHMKHSDADVIGQPVPHKHVLHKTSVGQDFANLLSMLIRKYQDYQTTNLAVQDQAQTKQHAQPDETVKSYTSALLELFHTNHHTHLHAHDEKRRQACLTQLMALQQKQTLEQRDLFAFAFDPDTGILHQLHELSTQSDLYHLHIETLQQILRLCLTDHALQLAALEALFNVKEEQCLQLYWYFGDKYAREGNPILCKQYLDSCLHEHSWDNYAIHYLCLLKQMQDPEYQHYYDELKQIVEQGFKLPLLGEIHLHHYKLDDLLKEILP